MTATGVDPLLVCSTSTSFSAAAATGVSRKFMFPAKSEPTVAFRGRTSKASSSAATPACGDDSNFTSCGRRGIISVATSPLVLHMFEALKCFRANAAEDILPMKEEIRKVLSKGKAPGVLRLAFHDAGTFEIDENSGGMNGSIVYELDRPENTGLQKPLKILEKAKTEVDAIRPVSWADIIAVAGAEAVVLCGGPTIPLRLGRIDSMIADAEGRLPQESLDAFGLKQCFQRKGFSTQELVVLSGAHTLGSKGFGNPNVFDNSYFKYF